MDHWTIEEAYKAYAPQMGIAYSIDEAISKATGRIILVDTSDLSLYNKFENKDEFDEIEIKEFNTKYRNYTYKFVTLQKRTT